MFRLFAVIMSFVLVVDARAACPIPEPQDKVENNATTLLEQKDYAGLDAIALRYRTKEVFSPAGSLTLNAYYGVLGSPKSECDKKVPGPEAWLEREQELAAWTKALPQSSTARIAYGVFLTRFAWQGRGGGYSHEVTPERRALYVERTRQAREVLESIPREGRNDPWWFRAMLDVGQAQRWPAATFDELLDRGVAQFPHAYRLYQIGVVFHSAKWYGSDADVTAYIERMVKMTRKKMGETMYTKLHEHAYLTDSYSAEHKPDWARVKAGHERIVRDYPVEWNQVLFAQAACKARDTATLKKQLKIIGKGNRSLAWEAPGLASQCERSEDGPVECYTRTDTKELLCFPVTPKA